jgi:hypothetical protein
MKPIDQVYPEYAAQQAQNGYFYGPCDYMPLLESFGYTILLKLDDQDYQGDSRLIFQDGARFGVMIFGWGSCSGCDALQGCDNMEEIAQLRDELHDSIKWFDSAAECLTYFNTHDWVGDYSWHADETKEFIAQGKEILSKLVDVNT